MKLRDKLEKKFRLDENQKKAQLKSLRERLK